MTNKVYFNEKYYTVSHADKELPVVTLDGEVVDEKTRINVIEKMEDKNFLPVSLYRYLPGYNIDKGFTAPIANVKKILLYNYLATVNQETLFEETDTIEDIDKMIDALAFEGVKIEKGMYKATPYFNMGGLETATINNLSRIIRLTGEHSLDLTGDTMDVTITDNNTGTVTRYPVVSLQPIHIEVGAPLPVDIVKFVYNR